ncbi:hypothetical protein HK105_208196, partial [Polyrhizophydium stewartii]
MLAIALAPAVVAQGRPHNKAANNITITVVDQGIAYLADQLLFGIRMAAREINSNPNVLQDVTIKTARFLLPSISNKAAMYDAVVGLCDSAGQVALASPLNSPIASTVSFICPQLPHMSPYSALPMLSDKSTYPLFYRFVVSATQQVQAAVAQHKYFGWTRVGIIYVNTNVWAVSTKMLAARLSLQLFPASGISVEACVLITPYDPAVSKFYYPQISNQFEFLKSTKLRVFLAYVDTWQTMDVMMAASRVGLAGHDYDTPINPSLLQGVGLIWFNAGPFFDDPYLQSWIPRFLAAETAAISTEPQLYYDLKPNETDTTKQSYPANFFFDDPGTDK